MAIVKVPLDTETGHVGDPPEPKDFSFLLVEHLNGRTHTEISALAHELVEAVQAHGKKGSLTIELVIEPTTKGPDSPIAIAFETKLKKPEAAAPRATFFVNRLDRPEALLEKAFSDIVTALRAVITEPIMAGSAPRP